MLHGVLQHAGANLSAHQTIDAENAACGSIARLSAELETIAAEAQRDNRLHNSLVGDVEVTGEALALAGDGLVLIAYTAEPDTPSAAALRFLGGWATDWSRPSPSSPLNDEGRRP
ncbi:hypothetical protein GCM10022237_06230 [Nocardioides ginsengisoli]|uniref:MmyB-like transcription regulator ligand binding domain-containing protein n=1 Tax=Nocardioides ginsengisoli TaxID=363868 RepID=A0ABW3VX76_9ACTN